MSKCVEVQWNITPFRSDKFIELWQPHAECVADYGASGYALFRSLDDQLVVRQFAFFDSKEQWESYWNSDRIIKAREEAMGLFQVPIVYVWHEVISSGSAVQPAAA